MAAPSATTGGQSKQRHKDAFGGDEASSAAVSLSMSFAVVIKLIDELLLQLRNYEEWQSAKHNGITSLLKVDEKFLDAFMVMDKRVMLFSQPLSTPNI